MQVAIFDYYNNSITIFDLPKDIEKQVLDTDSDFDLSEYIESLPGYDGNSCYWMSGANNGNITVRIGKQSDFPEFNKEN